MFTDLVKRVLLNGSGSRETPNPKCFPGAGVCVGAHPDGSQKKTSIRQTEIQLCPRVEKPLYGIEPATCRLRVQLTATRPVS